MDTPESQTKELKYTTGAERENTSERTPTSMGALGQL